ncbi:MAG: DUF2070 family protein [Archaeoglobaceae archaeon]
MGKDQTPDLKSVESLHSKLFSVPRGDVLAAFTAAVVVLSLMSDALMRFWLSLFLTTLTATKLGLKFNVKRAVFFTNLMTMVSAVLLPIKAISATSLLVAATYYFCSDRKAVTFLATLPAVVSQPSAAPIGLVSLLFLAAYLKMLDARYGRVNVREFVERFVLHWLTRDPRYLEELFDRWGVERDGRVRCVCVGDAKLVTTDFHPGPFRNVGGARLVEVLSEDNAIYLHSPTSHRMNPTSSAEVEKLKGVSCYRKLKPMKPFVIDGEAFEVFCFPFDATRLIFVSGKRAIDDFEISSESIVIDCHNAHGDFDASEIERLVAEAERRESQPSKCRYAFVKIPASTESICSYAATLLLDYEGERYAIVSFDSNNVLLEFRRFVEELFAGIGYRAIVTSTDNHAKTGVRAKTSYKPAGSCREDYKIAHRLFELCKTSELVEADFSFGERVVRLKVFDDILTDAELAASSSTRYIATFLALNIALVLLAAILEVVT